MQPGTGSLLGYNAKKQRAGKKSGFKVERKPASWEIRERQDALGSFRSPSFLGSPFARRAGKNEGDLRREDPLSRLDSLGFFARRCFRWLPPVENLEQAKDSQTCLY